MPLRMIAYAVTAATLLLLIPAAAGASGALERTAEVRVSQLLAQHNLVRVRVRCSPRAREAARVRLSCRWHAWKRVRGRRADRRRGRATVSHAGRRWRVHLVGPHPDRQGAPVRKPAPNRWPPTTRPPGGMAPAPSEEPPPSASRSRPLFGFNDNAVRGGALSAGADAELSATVGANVTRLTFDWRWVEPRKGELELGAYDEIYGAMLARGVRPVFVLMFAPQWAWDAGAACNQWTQDCRYPPAPDHYADWRRIAALLATRYPQAAGIEVWNEPNFWIFWSPQPDPVRYTELLKQAYVAIKGANPSMRVISGGLTNHEYTGDGVVSMTDFASGIYRNGGKDYMDALAFHPYPWGEERWIPGKSFVDLRAVRDSFGDSGKPLWITEAGITTTGPDPARRFTEAQQAEGLARYYRTVSAMPDVEAIILHTLIDNGTDPADPETGYGIVRRDLTRKPAFCALAAERGAVNACP
jgi:polysaccharide biosynthesis protein PslG